MIAEIPRIHFVLHLSRSTSYVIERSYAELIHLNICLMISKCFHASFTQITWIYVTSLFFFFCLTARMKIAKKSFEFCHWIHSINKRALWDWCPSGMSIWNLNVNLTVLESNNSAHFLQWILIYGPSWWRLQGICFRERTPESPLLKFVFWDKVDTYININTD
jgi:DNA-binding XRE family transcriptional regulator